MGQENGVGNNVTESDEVVILDVTIELLVIGTSGENLPIVVGVIEWVTSDLLTLAGNTTIVIPQRITLRVAVKVSLGLLVLDRDGVVIVNGDGVAEHDVVAQGLLELGGHEIITGAGAGENGEVNLEPEEVKEEGQEDQAESSSSKVLAELSQGQSSTRPLNIQQVPKLNDNSRTNGDEGEKTNVFGRDIAGKGKSSEDQPLPPLP